MKSKMYHPTRALTLNNKVKILKSKLSPQEGCLSKSIFDIQKTGSFLSFKNRKFLKK
ncbi:MAG: hypothetical protein ABIG37_00650 [Nanoarchaeota archaeon]|nr:hypothetical protein [Nanoarchaeota archaeon]